MRSRAGKPSKELKAMREDLVKQFVHHIEMSDRFDAHYVAISDEEDAYKEAQQLCHEYRCRAAQDLLSLARTYPDPEKSGRAHAARAVAQVSPGLLENYKARDFLDIGWWLHDGGDPLLRHEHHGKPWTELGAWLRLRKIARAWSKRQQGLTVD